MTRSSSVVLLLVLAAAFAVLPATSIAQDPHSSPGQTTLEPLGENENIPFMQSDKAVVSEEPSSAGLLAKTLGSMALIVGLIFAGAWAAKKLGYGSGKTDLAHDATAVSVLTSVSLGNGRSVSAIRFGSRTLLVGSTPQSFTLLAENVDDREASDMAIPRSVAEMLADDSFTFDEQFQKASSQLDLLGQAGRNA